MKSSTIDFIRNALRQSSVKWEGRSLALQRARKKVFVRKSKLGKSIYKYYWQCAHCEKWYRDVKQVEVDHCEEIGSFNGDWNEYLERMFPDDPSALQVLCITCHMKKTLAYNSARSKWKRKRLG